MTSPLLNLLRDRIRAEGPIRLAEYMQLALTHPDYGYYSTRDPLGRGGDFITAPEVHQAFGEIIGAWIGEVWQQLGRPKRWQLVEWGPGRGTLMQDVLRSLEFFQRKRLPGLIAGCQVTLVDSSPTLRQAQINRLNDTPCEVEWREDCLPLPEIPFVLLANEFLDALPVNQYRKTAKGWEECRVAWDEAKAALAWHWLPLNHELSFLPDNAVEGDRFEHCPAAHLLMQQVAGALTRHHGAALFIDYGYRNAGLGESLQAIRQHRPHDPLQMPGEADLTAHVDFARLKQTAEQAGASVTPIATQSFFLLSVGLQQRMEMIGRHHPAEQHTLSQAFVRLVSPEQMGELFKAMALYTPGQPMPPGFVTRVRKQDQQ